MSSAADVQAPSAVEDAVAQGLGALLADKDVLEIQTLEGGMIEVLRRGKRERIDAILEGQLFALLREHGAEKGVLRLKLKGGQLLVCGPLVDGRAALRITKPPALDATLDALVQEGVLPPGIGEELVAAVLEGAGVLVLGPSRAGRQRVLAAVVRALQGRVSWFACTDNLSALVPVALERTASTVEKAKAAVVLGADALCALELDVEQLALLARASLGVPLCAAVACPSMDALRAALLRDHVDDKAAAGNAAVIGHGPDGRPRLVELHGPTRASGDATEASLPPIQARGSSGGSSEHSGSRQRPRPPVEPRAAAAAAATGDEEALPPLAELPAGWASDDADADPGWELAEQQQGGGGPAAPGSFDAALAAQKARPSFAPKPPRPHPQTAALRGDPFGGLTLEPPPGGGDDDEPDR